MGVCSADFIAKEAVGIRADIAFQDKERVGIYKDGTGCGAMAERSDLAEGVFEKMQVSEMGIVEAYSMRTVIVFDT